MTTQYADWGTRNWWSMTPEQQEATHKDMERLHAARCILESLNPRWRIQALRLLQVYGFDPKQRAYPDGRDDLAAPRHQATAMEWAVLKSGIDLGRRTYAPGNEPPALAAFEALKV